MLLVGGLVAIFYFPIYWVANHPNWLSYFSEGFKPPTRLVFFNFMWQNGPRSLSLQMLWHQANECPTCLSWRSGALESSSALPAESFALGSDMKILTCKHGHVTNKSWLIESWFMFDCDKWGLDAETDCILSVLNDVQWGQWMKLDSNVGA